MRKAKQATTVGEGILLAGAHLIWAHLEAPKLYICDSNLMIWDNLIAPENSLLTSETIIWKLFSVIRLELSATDLAEHMDLLNLLNQKPWHHWLTLGAVSQAPPCLLLGTYCLFLENLILASDWWPQLHKGYNDTVLSWKNWKLIVFWINIWIFQSIIWYFTLQYPRYTLKCPKNTPKCLIMP